MQGSSPKGHTRPQPQPPSEIVDYPGAAYNPWIRWTEHRTDGTKGGVYEDNHGGVLGHSGYCEEMMVYLNDLGKLDGPELKKHQPWLKQHNDFFQGANGGVTSVNGGGGRFWNIPEEDALMAGVLLKKLDAVQKQSLDGQPTYPCPNRIDESG